MDEHLKNKWEIDKLSTSVFFVNIKCVVDEKTTTIILRDVPVKLAEQIIQEHNTYEIRTEAIQHVIQEMEGQLYTEDALLYDSSSKMYWRQLVQVLKDVLNGKRGVIG